jgi:hypothetical protein
MKRGILQAAWPTLGDGSTWQLLILALVASLAGCSCLRELAGQGPGRQGTIYLVGGLLDEQLVALSAAVAAQPDALLLLDSIASRPYIKDFLSCYKPKRLVAVGSFGEGVDAVQSRLGCTIQGTLSWSGSNSSETWNEFYSNPKAVVVCAAYPRELLLEAACLAGVAAAPLLVTAETGQQHANIERLLASWKLQRIYLIGSVPVPKALQTAEVIQLHDVEKIRAATLYYLLGNGAISTIVVANPDDGGSSLGGMSVLAPLIAVRHHALLFLTNGQGNNVRQVVSSGVAQCPGDIDSVIWVAAPAAIPPERRPNPEPGKDANIEMDPLTPADNAPVSFATGRMFHADRAVVLLTLARQKLLEIKNPPLHALIASNPGGSLPLLEAFSRNTAKELENSGYETTALFEDEVNADVLRRLLPRQDIFLWEGHHLTLTRDYGYPTWAEPTGPALVLLQSCLALNEVEVGPLLGRGAVAIVGSSTRTFSGSGGAFTLAFLDSLLYDGQSLGDGLRQAKNFLLAYSELKQQLLGNAKKSGANQRSAWAFSLWGDPTLRLPRPRPGPNALQSVRHLVHGHSIIISLPEQPYPMVTSGKYQTQMLPNARLAGLVGKELSEDGQRLVPFVFSEIGLPWIRKGETPHLRSRIPEKHWIFLWDARLRRGYLLVAPRPKDQREIRFWVD